MTTQKYLAEVKKTLLESGYFKQSKTDPSIFESKYGSIDIKSRKIMDEMNDWWTRVPEEEDVGEASSFALARILDIAEEYYDDEF